MNGGGAEGEERNERDGGEHCFVVGPFLLGDVVVCACACGAESSLWCEGRERVVRLAVWGVCWSCEQQGVMVGSRKRGMDTPAPCSRGRRTLLLFATKSATDVRKTLELALGRTGRE